MKKETAEYQYGFLFGGQFQAGFLLRGGVGDGKKNRGRRAIESRENANAVDSL